MKCAKIKCGLSGALHHQLNLYALAAGAAGVGVQALAQPAEAKVVYTPAHVVVSGDSGFYWLDLNHDGIPDLRLGNYLACTETCWNSLYVGSPITGKNAVDAARTVLYTFAYALDKGARIDSKGPFKWFADMVRGGKGQWYDVTNRYLGIKFQIKGKTHYGWARLTVTGTYDTVVATLTGYAYETIPDKAIIAGRTKGPEVVTVQPASLGHLAQGSAGLSAWRSAK